MADLQPVSAVARLLDVTERQVYELARDGTIPRAQRGRYDLVACVRAYIRHLREVAAGRQSRDGKLDLPAERARLAREQADHQSMKNALLRKELVPVSDVETAFTTVHSAVQQRLLGIPSVVAPLVAIEEEARTCEAIIREHIEEALQEIADAEIDVTYTADALASDD